MIKWQKKKSRIERVWWTSYFYITETFFKIGLNVEGNAKTNRTTEEETELRDKNIRFTVAIEKKFLKQFGDIYGPRIELCLDSFLIEKLDQTKAKEFIKYLKNLTNEHAQEHLDEFVQVMKDVIESK